MVGQSRPKQLDRLIDEVARGDRELSSIRDASQREAVRIALRLHKESAQEPDAYTRIRMRARVLGTLRPRHATLRDHAWTALELIARPAPYLMRAIAVASVLVCFGMGAIVASADTMPDDLLYPVKLGTETVRLGLAETDAERAVIELSIAEHRLHEAERLAASGRASDALVASAMYSQHVAWAAADLAPQAPSDLALQLEQRFDADRTRAQTLASTLSANTKSAGAARVLMLLAQPTALPGDTGMQRVASTAAGVAEQLVQVAEAGALDASATRSDVLVTVAPRTPEVAAPAVEPSHGPSTGPSSAASAAPRTSAHPETPRATQSPRAPERTDQQKTDQQKANAVLQTVRKALEETKAAAEKAKSGHK